MSSDVFWKAKLEELEKGYIFDGKTNEYTCLICGKQFEKGIVYNIGDKFCDAEKAVNIHITEEHKSVFDELIEMDKKYTGISDIQTEILKYFYDGMNDADIAKKVGSSPSTIRNHRFRMKEKSKQAKIFLALIELMDAKISEEDKIIDIHRNAKMVDDRYAITNSEKDETLRKFVSDGRIIKLPNKEKEKLIVLMWIIENFELEVEYTEKQVNEILKQKYDDFVILRRYLIQYGFMNRKLDGSSYWVVF